MSPERPNIIHIVPHDLGADLGCLGHPTVKTPNLDVLAAGGMRFTNHFCASTPCSPARGCTMTGRYAHSNGLIGLVNFGWSLPEDERTIVDCLNDTGYQTCHIGFAHERSRERNRYQKELNELRGIEAWYAEVVCDGMIDFLKSRKAEDGPFYLNAGFFEVHAPWKRPQYDGRYKLEDIIVPPFLPDNEAIRKILAQYYGSVSFMDECVGRVLDALGELGLDKNTLVIFTTDHGISFPRAKSTMYDPGLRTALLMRWPGHIEAGSACAHLINNIDLCPTLLELLDLPVPDTVQGRSFKGYLTGGAYTPNAQIFSERNFHEDFDPMRAVRTERYKYIRNFAERCHFKLPHEGQNVANLGELVGSGRARPEEELYDLEKDPNEFNNVAEDPAYAEVLKDLRGRVITWMDETADFMRGAYEFIHYPSKDRRYLSVE